MMDEKLVKKLRLDNFKNIDILRPSKDASTVFDDYSFNKSDSEKLDLAIAYIYSLEEMKIFINKIDEEKIIKENGLIYLAYPKNKNKLGHNPIHRDSIFPFLEVDEDTGYVKDTVFKFNKMVSLDENYTLVGLKNISKNTKISNSSKSNRVDDYVDKIEDIEKVLKDYPEELEFYRALTPGYKKDWARYIYSAKTQKTIDKRIEEMVDILGKGYKTKELYRQSLKK